MLFVVVVAAVVAGPLRSLERPRGVENQDRSITFETKTKLPKILTVIRDILC